MQRCLITASRRTENANGDTEEAALMFGSLYFILIRYQLAVKLAMLELMCVCVCVCVRAPARSLQLFPYTSRINFKVFIKTFVMPFLTLLNVCHIFCQQI